MVISDILLMPGRLTVPVFPGAFRLFLALLVFVHHFSSFGFGPYAVYVFFVLSGYWVQTMWAGRYSRAHQPYLTFVISRLWRLTPVMLLASLWTFAVLLVVGYPAAQVFAASWFHLAFSTTFLLGYAWLAYLPVGAAWSLDVETQFYLVAPLLIAVLRRQEWLVVLVLSAATSLLSSTFFATPVLPKHLFFFVVGMSAAHAGWVPARKFALASGWAVLTITIAVTFSPYRGILFGGSNPPPLHVWNPQYNVVMALLTIPFALYTVRQPSDRLDRDMADLSYIIYLFHWAGMQWFFTVQGSFSERLAVAAVCFTVVPILSVVVLYLYDRPINRLRDRWVRNRIEPVARPIGDDIRPAIL